MSFLGNPAMPVALLLNGQLYYLGGMSVFGVHPTTMVTGGYYGALALWGTVGILAGRQWRAIRFSPADLAAAAFLFLVTVALVLSPYSEARKYLAFTAMFLVVPYGLARMLTAPQVVSLIRITISLSWIMFVIVLVWLWFSTAKNWYGDRPMLFGYGHTVLLAGLLLGALAALLSGYVTRPGAERESRKYRYLGFACLLPILWTLQIIAARGGYYAALLLVSGALLAAVWLPFRRRFFAMLLLAVFVKISFLVLPVKQLEYFHRLVPAVSMASGTGGLHGETGIFGIVDRKLRMPESIRNDCDRIDNFQFHGMSAEARKLLYGNAIGMFLQHPWLGVGAIGYGYELCNNGGYFPHSTILQTLAELGMIGGIPFLGVIALVLLGLVRVILRPSCRDHSTIAWIMLVWWGFYLVTDQLYGDYFLALPFILLSGASVAVISRDRQARERA